MVKPGSATVLVKYEGLNVGGSIKTRTALNMIEAGEQAGLIRTGYHYRGNRPVGTEELASRLVGAVRGYKTIIIMPDSVSPERRRLVEHYGAEVRLIHDK